MTSIEVLMKEIYDALDLHSQGKLSPTYFLVKIVEAKSKAIEMHKQEIIDAAERWKGTDFAERYYQETFVNKGSETCKENLQVELSDEEIEKAAKEFSLEDLITSQNSFELGAKWYREQLKLKTT